jgi:hypothetical protein
MKETAMNMKKLVSLAVVIAALGCEDQTKKSPNSIIGKTTQDIGEYDAKKGAEVSDSKIRASDPITAPMMAYGPMLEQISKSHIAAAVNLFEANEGRYPADLDEFMEKIIKPNNIKLPVLPGGKKYQYDVENHKLVVIDAPDAAKP